MLLSLRHWRRHSRGAVGTATVISVMFLRYWNETEETHPDHNDESKVSIVSTRRKYQAENPLLLQERERVI